MRRALVFLAALCLASAATASLVHAQLAPVLGFSWDQCAGDGRIVDRSFSCDTNTGSEAIVASITFRDGLRRTGISVFECKIDVTASSTTVPSWWALDACRSTAISFSFAPPAAGSTCLDFWGTSSSGGQGGGGMLSESPSPAERVIRMIGATADSVWLDSDHEYQLFRMSISHGKTVGANACAGCAVPMCLGLRGITLERPPGGEEEYFLVGSPASTVTWQGGHVVSYTPHPHGYGESQPCICPETGNLMCTTGPVPAQSQTWGMIKSMYR